MIFRIKVNPIRNSRNELCGLFFSGDNNILVFSISLYTATYSILANACVLKQNKNRKEFVLNMTLICAQISMGIHISKKSSI